MYVLVRIHIVVKGSQIIIIVSKKKIVCAGNILLECMKGRIGGKPAYMTMLGLIWASTSITASLFCLNDQKDLVHPTKEVKSQ